MEAVASFLVPTWPARDIRPIAVTSTPEITYNDWGLRDRPRTFARPAGVRLRSVLIGDSFLEGAYLATLSACARGPGPARATPTARRSTSASPPPDRANTTTVSATSRCSSGPTCRAGVYAGNDFAPIPTAAAIPPASPSGRCPRCSARAAAQHWLIVNRLGLAEIGRGNKPIRASSSSSTWRASRPPSGWPDRRAHQALLFRRSTRRHPEILSRGGERLWQAFARAAGPESLAGWLLNSVIDWETGTWTCRTTPTRPTGSTAGAMVDETLSWLVGARRRRGARRRAGRCADPGRHGDPDYVDFWQPWPQYYSASLSERPPRGSPALRTRRAVHRPRRGPRGRAALTGCRRSLDELGTEIVADRVAREVLELAPN